MCKPLQLLSIRGGNVRTLLRQLLSIIINTINALFGKFFYDKVKGFIEAGRLFNLEFFNVRKPYLVVLSLVPVSILFSLMFLLFVY